MDNFKRSLPPLSSLVPFETAARTALLCIASRAEDLKSGRDNYLEKRRLFLSSSAIIVSYPNIDGSYAQVARRSAHK